MGQQNLIFNFFFFWQRKFDNFQHAISVPTHVLVHTFNTIIRTRTFIYLFIWASYFSQKRLRLYLVFHYKNT